MTPPTPKDVHRYDFDGDYGYCGCTISAYNNGDYVLYTDYLALAAERDAMKAERDALRNGKAVSPTPEELDCECVAYTKLAAAFDEVSAERDAAESLVSAQHDALVAMKNERDAWEHRAEVAERENGDALAMLAFTGETSLWQAAAATRAKRDEAVRERDDADDALAACQAQAAGTIARLREALDKWEDSALNLLAVVHRDGGQHTATVGFSASCTEAEAVVVALRAKLAEAERERDDAKINETLSNEQRAVLFCENAKLLANLDAAEKDAARYQWLKARLLGVDWAFGDPSESVMLFTIPNTMRVSGNLDATLDTARTAATAKGE